MGLFGESKQKKYAREIRKAYHTDQLPKAQPANTNRQRTKNIIQRVKERRKEKKLRQNNYGGSLPTHGTGGRGIRGKVRRRLSRTAHRHY